tara:strand:+ start:463 stop:951 length:489 start_codon:yes stop_codon:yes gene_type:complete
MGMLSDSVDKMVKGICEDETKELVHDAIKSKMETTINDVIDSLTSADGIKSMFKEILMKKLQPVIDEIDKIDIQPLIDTVADINLGEGIEEEVEALQAKLKDTITQMVTMLDNVKVDLSAYNGKINEAVGEEMVEVLEYDDDVKNVIKEKVVGGVKAIEFKG